MTVELPGSDAAPIEAESSNVPSVKAKLLAFSRGATFLGEKVGAKVKQLQLEDEERKKEE